MEHFVLALNSCYGPLEALLRDSKYAENLLEHSPPKQRGLVELLPTVPRTAKGCPIPGLPFCSLVARSLLSCPPDEGPSTP
jgi:hypothetical protein